MELQITRNSDKPHVIKYIRDDGSETWMAADDFFIRHDLSHYAIEKTLHYTTAFMGMLNNGMDIKDFENRVKRKQIVVTQEAMYAENMANLFLMELIQGSFDDFNTVSGEAFSTMSLQYTPPVLSEEQLAEVRNFLRQLLNNWKALPAGQTITLNFDF